MDATKFTIKLATLRCLVCSREFDVVKSKGDHYSLFQKDEVR
jgi:hypothetical protein